MPAGELSPVSAAAISQVFQRLRDEEEVKLKLAPCSTISLWPCSQVPLIIPPQMCADPHRIREGSGKQLLQGSLCSPLALGQVCDSPIHVALISTYDHLNLWSSPELKSWAILGIEPFWTLKKIQNGTFDCLYTYAISLLI